MREPISSLVTNRITYLLILHFTLYAAGVTFVEGELVLGNAKPSPINRQGREKLAGLKVTDSGSAIAAAAADLEPNPPPPLTVITIPLTPVSGNKSQTEQATSGNTTIIALSTETNGPSEQVLEINKPTMYPSLTAPLAREEEMGRFEDLEADLHLLPNESEVGRGKPNSGAPLRWTEGNSNEMGDSPLLSNTSTTHANQASEGNSGKAKQKRGPTHVEWTSQYSPGSRNPWDWKRNQRRWGRKHRIRPEMERLYNGYRRRKHGEMVGVDTRHSAPIPATTYQASDAEAMPEVHVVALSPARPERPSEEEEEKFAGPPRGPRYGHELPYGEGEEGKVEEAFGHRRLREHERHRGRRWHKGSSSSGRWRRPLRRRRGRRWGRRNSPTHGRLGFHIAWDKPGNRRWAKASS